MTDHNKFNDFESQILFDILNSPCLTGMILQLKQLKHSDWDLITDPQGRTLGLSFRHAQDATLFKLRFDL